MVAFRRDRREAVSLFHVVICRCPLLAQSGHIELRCTCPLLGAKPTWRFALHMSAFDPRRTSLGLATTPS
jgi:hypothetical protein